MNRWICSIICVPLTRIVGTSKRCLFQVLHQNYMYENDSLKMSLMKNRIVLVFLDVPKYVSGRMDQGKARMQCG